MNVVPLPTSLATVPASVHAASTADVGVVCAGDGAGASASLYACGKRRILFSLRGLPPLPHAHTEYQKRIATGGGCSVDVALLGDNSH